MTPRELRRIRQSYTFALLQAARAWRRVADSVVDAYGLSEATALPLVLIGRLPGHLRQSALAEALGVEGPTLVRLLDQLCAAGLVTRREDPTDRRAKIVSLTKAGQSAVATIEAELIELRANVLASVSASDLEGSMRVFDAIRQFGAPERIPEEQEA